MHRTTPWLLLVGTIIAGCSTVAPTQTASPEASRSADQSASSAPTPSASSLLPLGRYTADVPEGVEAAPGEWSMTIAEDGITWTNPETGAVFSPGDVLDVTTSTIVFAPDPQCPDQGDAATPGTYGWELDGFELRFTLEADSCAGRRDTLTAAPWMVSR